MNIYPRTKTEMSKVLDLPAIQLKNIHCAHITKYYLAMKSNQVPIPATVWARHENSRFTGCHAACDCIYIKHTKEVTLQKHNAAWGLSVPLEDEEIEGTVYWVSFGVGEAILGPEMVITQQYGYTRYHRTVQF